MGTEFRPDINYKIGSDDFVKRKLEADSIENRATNPIFTASYNDEIGDTFTIRNRNSRTPLIRSNKSIQQTADNQRLAVVEQLKKSKEELKAKFEKERASQGWLGNTWDFVKNHAGVSGEGKSWWNPAKWYSCLVNSDCGSNAVEKEVTSFDDKLSELEKLSKSGNDKEFADKYKEITGKDLDLKEVAEGKALEGSKVEEKVKGYSESQKNGTDVIADIGAGIVSGMAYSAAIAGVIFAIPTGGASLALTAGALAIATGVGAATKTAIKSTDAWSGGRSYDSFAYDITTGGLCGLLAPISGGVGGAVTKTFGKEAVIIAGEQVAKEAVIAGGEAVAKNTVVQTVVNHMGKEVAFKEGTSFIKRAALKTAGTLAEGATFGAVDNPTRVAFNGGSLTDIVLAVPEGAIGGAAIGTAMHAGHTALGKGFGFLKGKLKSVPEKPTTSVHSQELQSHNTHTGNNSTGQATEIKTEEIRQNNNTLNATTPEIEAAQSKPDFSIKEEPIAKSTEGNSAHIANITGRAQEILKDFGQHIHTYEQGLLLKEINEHNIEFLADLLRIKLDDRPYFDNEPYSAGSIIQILRQINPVTAPKLRKIIEMMGEERKTGLHFDDILVIMMPSLRCESEIRCNTHLRAAQKDNLLVLLMTTI